MIDTFREIIGSLSRNKLRTIATGFAVASGLFLLIVLQGASNGIIHTFEQNSEGFSFDAIQIYPGFTSKPFEGMKEGRNIQLD
jgi:putative ABC transport system permease protein